MLNATFYTDEDTRRRMQRVHSKDTPIEILVRRRLHALGYRFRLHRSNLPGKPDIVLPKYMTVMFVHGCFWHGHEACAKGRRRPKRNAETWEQKITYNRVKDERAAMQLCALGWKVVTIWECETRNSKVLEGKLKHGLGVTT